MGNIVKSLEPEPGISLFFFFFLTFNFIFRLYITVLVLPNIKMNPPQVYMPFKILWTLTKL